MVLSGLCTHIGVSGIEGSRILFRSKYLFVSADRQTEGQTEGQTNIQTDRCHSNTDEPCNI